MFYRAAPALKVAGSSLATTRFKVAVMYAPLAQVGPSCFTPSRTANWSSQMTQLADFERPFPLLCGGWTQHVLIESGEAADTLKSYSAEPPGDPSISPKVYVLAGHRRRPAARLFR